MLGCCRVSGTALRSVKGIRSGSSPEAGYKGEMVEAYRRSIEPNILCFRSKVSVIISPCQGVFMKRVILFILVVFLLTSCSTDYEILDGKLGPAWVKTASYTYMEDTMPNALFLSWKSPKQFEADGGGDCEDFATHLIYALGPEASAVVCNMYGGPHMIVYYDGMYIEPQNYGVVYSNVYVTKRYSYTEVMQYSTGFGTRSIE